MGEQGSDPEDERPPRGRKRSSPRSVDRAVRVHESSGGWKQRTIESQYDLGEEIARGGMGRILTARDRELGREVAVKVLSPQSEAISNAVVERFLQEAQITAQLEHPNILPVYGVESATGAPAFTMRLLGRRTLKSYLQECRDAEEAGAADSDHRLEARLERFLGVCNAITYAHARGVVHRDLKPSNVLLGKHFAVYVVDWGAAKLLDPDAVRAYGDVTEAPMIESDADVETKAGELIGTPTYMSPEQAMGAVDEHGPAADQFALGMILQELVTLQPPRSGKRSEHVAKAVIGERAAMKVPPEQAGLAAIVARATESEPEDRYPSVIEFAEDVRSWLRRDGVSVLAQDSVPPSAPAPPVSSAPPRPRRMTLVLLAGLAVLTGSLGAIAASLWWTGRADDETADRRRVLALWTGRVARHGAQLDRHLGRVGVEVAGLAARFEERLTRSRDVDAEAEPPDEPTDAATDELAQLVDRLAGQRYAGMGRLAASLPLHGAQPSDDYGMPVSFDHTGVMWPPDVSVAEVDPHLRALGDVTSMLAAPLAPDGEGESLALHLVYGGFESGVLVNYPAYALLPDEYDPRRRPWYRGSRDSTRPHFGAPYPDASGTGVLVPCSLAVRDGEGRFLGVAGADFALGTVRDMIAMTDVEGWRRSSLIDMEHREFVDTDRPEAAPGIGLHDDAPSPTHAIDADLEEALSRDQHAGWLVRADELVFYRRLTQIGWTLVVRADR